MRKSKVVKQSETPIAFVPAVGDLFSLPRTEVTRKSVEIDMETQRGTMRWKFTGESSGNVSAEEMFELARVQTESKGEAWVVQIPDEGKELRIVDESYRQTILLLKRVIVEPKWGIDEWVIFGHKAGFSVMSKVLALAGELSGMGAGEIMAGIADAKKV